MTAARKIKVSVSIDAIVMDAVDGQAESEGTTRSAVMERWLRQVSRRAAVTRLEEDTAAYYDSLSPADREDDASWAAASSVAARELAIDVTARDPGSSSPPSSSSPRRRRRPARG